VTRIVAGRARGRRLRVPAAVTRPTSDRVREALFSSLQAVTELAGARVLDLFAGSGALGLEALSRGAARAVLVDSSPAAAKVLEHNGRAVGLPGAQVRRQACTAYLQGPAEPFDLVLLDPPYDLPTEEVSQLLTALTSGWLAPGAVVVVERGSRADRPVWPAGFGGFWERRFGDTVLVRAVWYGHGQGRPDL
jgi:16S rRNA (guanine966-N2)-methyltransferase